MLKHVEASIILINAICITNAKKRVHYIICSLEKIHALKLRLFFLGKNSQPSQNLMTWVSTSMYDFLVSEGRNMLLLATIGHRAFTTNNRFQKQF